MQLPLDIRLAIETQAATIDSRLLRDAATRLSERYRSERGKFSSISSDAERVAYLITRFPATYAALCAVLSEVTDRMPQLDLRTLLDLGSGPGTAAWALSEVFPAVESLTLIERDRGFVRIGRQSADACGREPMVSAQWHVDSLAALAEYPRHDAVLMSYVLGEQESESVGRIVRQAWAATSGIVAIIEPGTPRGFQTIIAARTELIEIGANVVAPCPHQAPCPLIGRGGADWCHFAARIERTQLHRRLKSASLPYEDEKFAYVVAARDGGARPGARVIRHPLKLSGNVKLDLCTQTGIVRETVSRKEGERYKKARKLAWGAPWEPGPKANRLTN